MTPYLTIIGVISILGQVVILRELNVAFYGVELIYVVAIGLWLLWTGAGAAVGRRSYAPSPNVVGWLFIVFAAMLPIDVALIRCARALLGGVPGAFLPFGLQLLATAALLAPVGLVLGLMFQWAAKNYVSGGRTLARAYAIESAGGIAGGLVSAVLLKAGMQNFAIALCCSACAVAVPLLHGGGVRRPTENGRQPARQRARRAAGGALTVLLAVALLMSTALDRRLTRVNHPALVASSDSPYGRVTVSRQNGQVIVYDNDALAFESEALSAEEIVHVAAANIRAPRRVLILGGGVAGLLHEVLKLSPERVDNVELNPLLLETAEKYFPPPLASALRSPAVETHRTDPRAFAAGAGIYDLVIVGMPDPTSGQSNRFYTLDFFTRCARMTAPDGVLAFRLFASENVWTRFTMYRNTSIYRALSAVFHDVVVLPGRTNIVIASNRPLEREPAVLAERFSARGAETRLVTPQYFTYLYTNDRFYDIAKHLESTPIAPNTDARPVAFRYSGMIWLSQFIPSLINRDLTVDRYRATAAASGAVVLIAVLLFCIVRHRTDAKKMVIVGLAGFAGMVLEGVLLLHYQVKAGVLFQDIGVLLMMFMAGLAAGAWWVDRAARVASAVGRRVGYGLLAGFVLLSLIALAFIALDIPARLAAVSLAMLADGFLVAGVFAYASLAGVSDQRQVVSPLYAADLLGGCVGSLVGSILLIPFLGLGPSVMIVAVSALAALLFL